MLYALRTWCAVALCGLSFTSFAVEPPVSPTDIQSQSEGFNSSTQLANRASQEEKLQEQREQQLRQRQFPEPDILFPQPDHVTGPIPDETVCFPIHNITLTGDQSERFQWALDNPDDKSDPALGRCLGTKGINVVMERIQNVIIAKGYITTRVLAPSQNLASGTLSLTLVPGRVRDIRLDQRSDQIGTLWNALALSPGDLLNLRDIEQALEVLKRVPTAEADFQIVPGDEPGESDIVVLWNQSRQFRLSLAADDAGSKGTGRYQGTATLSVDNPLRLNDLFYVSKTHDLGGGDSSRYSTEGFSLYYSVPFSYWTLALAHRENNYEQTVAGSATNLLYSGENRNSSARLSRLVYRDGHRKTTVSIEGWLRESRNFINDTEILVQRRRMAGWAVDLQHIEFVGSGRLSLTVGYKRGTGAFKALPAPEETRNEGTARAAIISASAALFMPFQLQGQRFKYQGAYRAQWNKTPLTPQDRFSIGDRFSVRGFDGRLTLSSERGWLIRNDLGVMIGQSNQEAYLGLDYGRVSGPSAKQLVGHQLTGIAVGLRGSKFNVTYDLFIGTPLEKPDRFNTSGTNLGFHLVWSL